MKILFVVLTLFLTSCAPTQIRQHVGWIETEQGLSLAKGRCSGPTPINRIRAIEIILQKSGDVYDLKGSVVFKESFRGKLDFVGFQYEGGAEGSAKTKLQLLAYRELYGKGAESLRGLPNHESLEFKKDSLYPYRRILFDARVPYLERHLRIQLPEIIVDGVKLEKPIEFEFLSEWRIVPLNGC